MIEPEVDTQLRALRAEVDELRMLLVGTERPFCRDHIELARDDDAYAGLPSVFCRRFAHDPLSAHWGYARDGYHRVTWLSQPGAP